MEINLLKILGQSVMSLGNVAMGIVAPPWQRINEQEWNKLIPNVIPDLMTVIDLRSKGLMSKEEFEFYCLLNGANESTVNLIGRANLQRLSAVDYISLYRRGLLEREELEKRLEAIKYDSIEFDDLLRATEFLAGPSDLIRMAVREVFTPDIAEKFGQFENFPPEFASEASKLGMSEQTAKNFWAAHWELPSMSQGYQMFHRVTKSPIYEGSDAISTPNGKTLYSVIGSDELDMLMRSQDIMPHWRKGLKEISYSPLTRVDVRRMYAFGVLDQDGVFEAYLNDGYSPENAKLLTEFTIKHESNENDGITRANLVNAYVDNLLTEEQLRNYLERLGMTIEIIDFWVEQANYDKTIIDIKDNAQELSDQYQMGLIDLNTVNIKLAALDVPQQFIDSIVNKLIKKQAVRSKLPDKTDLVKWLTSGAIDDLTFTTMMRGQGYRDDAIQAYLSAAELETGGTQRKFLSESKYQKWLKSGIMTQDQFVATLTEKGLSASDIANLIAEA